MNSFGKVLKLVLRQPLALLGIALTALLVGVLWGGNISTIYPIVEVVFRGESLHEWIDLKIRECEEAKGRLEKELAGLSSAGSRERHSTSNGRGLAGPLSDQGSVSLLKRQIAQLELHRRQFEWVRPWVYRLTPSDAFSTLCFILGLLLVGTVLKSAALVTNSVLVARVAHQTVLHLRRQLFAHALRLELNRPGREGVAQLMSRFTHDMNAIHGGLTVLLGKMTREPLKMLACLGGAAYICWPLLVFSLLVVPPAGWAIWRLGRLLKRANRKAMEEMAQLYGTLEEALRSLPIVKAFTMEPYERRRFFETSRRYFAKGMKIAMYDALANPLTEVLGISIISLAMIAGAYVVLHGETKFLGFRMAPQPLSMPELVLFYALLAGAADPVRKLSDVFSGLQAAFAAADRVHAMLEQTPEVVEKRHARAIPRHRHHLVFDHVWFSYTPERPVLRDIHVTVRFGETLVIVGGSGCGKSTLISLIPRFFDPQKGEIRLDGVPLPEIRLRSLRKQIGLVTQEPVLFHDTILNNIKYGSPHATDEQAVDAARAAHAHLFIEQLPQGYDTVLGPMGQGLSGGQRQRIALARAILRDPAILILDEATSQIDVESEQLIQQALEKFIAGRTTIMITHRLSTIGLADRVMLMHDGQIVDIGPHEELLVRSPMYRRLHSLHYDDLKAA